MSRRATPSRITKSFFVRLGTKRPRLSRTTAATETTSTADRKVVFGAWEGASCGAALDGTHTSTSAKAEITGVRLIVTPHVVQGACQPAKLLSILFLWLQ